MFSLRWIPLDTLEGIEQLRQRSFTVPCLIYKHSHRCEICTIARYRLEDDWRYKQEELEAYLVDIIQHREVSLEVGQTFEVQHESPQMLLIVNGECVHDASHLDITPEEIREGLDVRNQPLGMK